MLDDALHAIAAEPDVSRAISPGDTMFTGDAAEYFGTGRSALRNVRLALCAAGRTDARRILDLPCGHGRVLRYLRAAFPKAGICACDLDRSGVDFCAETFGALPVHSAPEPSGVGLPGPFDLIWCGSLFTHLPAEKWLDFFRLFDSLLERGGLLVFTVHGRMSATYLAGGYTFGMGAEAAARTLETLDRDGFAYWEYPPEVGCAKGYGVSMTRPEWVVGELTRQPHLRLLGYSEASWFRHQDVVVCHKPPADRTSRSPSESDPLHT